MHFPFSDHFTNCHNLFFNVHCYCSEKIDVCHPWGFFINSKEIDPSKVYSTSDWDQFADSRHYGWKEAL